MYVCRYVCVYAYYVCNPMTRGQEHGRGRERGRRRER